MLNKETKVFRVIATEDDDCCEILVYGRIGDSGYYDDRLNNEQLPFIQILDDCAKKYQCIKVRINSPGGEVMHADGMARAIRKHADKIEMYADGVVASCAMDLYLAAPKAKRFAAKNAKFMLHKSRAMAYGTADDLLETSKCLQVFDDALAESLAENTGQTVEVVRKKYLEGGDHWFTATQALAEGFVGAIETYEAENVPAEAEKMNVEQLAQYYVERENTKPETNKPNSIISRMTNVLRGSKAAPSVTSLQEDKKEETIIPLQEEKHEEMTSENVLTALREGKISLDDMEKIVADEKAKQPISREVADGLVKKIADLEAKIDRMTIVNAGNGAPQAQGADPVVDTTVDPDAAILREAGASLKSFLL